MYCAYVTKLNNVRPHPNADKLLLGECFGNTICVSLDYKEGMLGVYFPTDGQVSIEFGEKNNLLRKKDENGKNIGGYLDPNKRNIKAIRLRDEKSDGIFLPLSCLDYCFEEGSAKDHLQIGDQITIVNGHEICQKYIPRGNKVSAAAGYSSGNRTRKKKEPIAPLFAEHADTEQLAYNLDAFKPGDEIEITLKMHGTSQRTTHSLVFKGYNDSFPYRVGNAICSIMNKIIGREVYKIKHDSDPVYNWDYISGTRRTILEDFDNGFYGSNLFREPHAEVFRNKLWKGETVYYEVVGFTHDETPIMSNGDNKKLGDDFVKQYGETTVFSYGCTPSGKKTMYGEDNDGTFALEVSCPQSDLYVYRMTMTNEDGCVVEYTPDFMRYRCEQMGVKCVPVFAKIYIKDDAVIAHHIDGTYSGGNIPEGWTIGDAVRDIAEKFYDGPDPIGKTHTREGVVVRIINRPKFCAYKHKNYEFKMLEGLIKETADAPDMEEAQSLVEEEGEN